MRTSSPSRTSTFVSDVSPFNHQERDLTLAVSFSVSKTSTTEPTEDQLGESYVYDQLQLLMGEPLLDVDESDHTGKPLIETTVARWLRTAAIYNTDGPNAESTNTTTADIKAVASMQPGRNFVRSSKIINTIQGGLASGDVTEERLHDDRSRRSRIEGEKQEAATGVGKQKKARAPKIDKMSAKQQEIIKLPINVLCPREAYSPDVYSYQFVGSNNIIAMFKVIGDEGQQRKAKKRGGKPTSGAIKGPGKRFTVPPVERSRMAVLADVGFRCATYLLTQQGYGWDDDKASRTRTICSYKYLPLSCDQQEWREIVSYVMKTEEMMAAAEAAGCTQITASKEASTGSASLAPFDFEVYRDKTRKELLRMSDIASHTWKLRSSKRGKRICATRQKSAKEGYKQDSIAKVLPSYLSDADAKSLADILQRLTCYLVNEQRKPADSVSD